MNNTVEDIIRVDSNHEILEEWNELISQALISERESTLRRLKSSVKNARNASLEPERMTK